MAFASKNSLKPLFRPGHVKGEKREMDFSRPQCGFNVRTKGTKEALMSY